MKSLAILRKVLQGTSYLQYVSKIEFELAALRSENAILESFKVNVRSTLNIPPEVSIFEGLNALRRENAALKSENTRQEKRVLQAEAKLEWLSNQCEEDGVSVRIEVKDDDMGDCVLIYREEYDPTQGDDGIKKTLLASGETTLDDALTAATAKGDKG